MKALGAWLARPRVIVGALVLLPFTQMVAIVVLGGEPGYVMAATVYLIAMPIAAVVCWRAARVGDPLESRSWKYFAAGFTLMAAGAAFAGMAASAGVPQLSHLGGYSRVLAAPLIVLGLRALPKGPHTRTYWQNVLDATTSLVCFLLVVWVVFNDTLAAPNGVEGVLLSLRPLVTALLATSAVMAMLGSRYGGGTALRRLTVCALGALLIAVGDCGMSFNDGLVGTSDALSLIPVTVGALFFAWAAARTDDGAKDSVRSRLYLGSLSPVVPLLAAWSLIPVLLSRRDPVDVVTQILVGLVLILVMVAVVSGRFDAFGTRETLEERISQRTLDIGTRERWFRALVQNSSDVVTVIDIDGVIRYQTPSAERVLGHDPRLMVGTRLSGLMRPADGRELDIALRTAASLPDSVQTLEFPIWHRDGRWRETETTITSLVNEPHVRAIVLNTRDVSERRRLQSELMHQAYSDALTGLANRALFRERTRTALEHAPTHEVAVLFLDLNGFKAVNDTQGHAVGDQLLALVGQRLKNSVRPGDLVARLGGDEFGILVTGDQAEAGAVWVADRVRRVLAHDFELDGRQVPLGAAIGIALNERGDESADQLLSNADLAMYRAKMSERTEFVRFEAAMHEDLLERVKAESDLRDAVARGDLSLHYQPIVDLRSGTVVGVEALARWFHAERGMVPPSEFIGVAEQVGLVDEIGTWALREACHHAARWQRFADVNQGVFRVAVNVSARQLTDSFPDVVRDALASGGLPGEALTIEVTESVLMERPDEVVELLSQIKALGVRIAVDDFGTGYSSLAYLARFPVDILKIDRAFVEDLTDVGEHSELARTIVHLGQSLGLKTVAEGIETVEQQRHLQELGCPFGQGFLFARPMPADEVDTFLVRADGAALAELSTSH